MLLTARHVICERNDGSSVKFGYMVWPVSQSPRSPVPVPVTVMAVSEKHDLALVSIVDGPTLDLLHKWELADACAIVRPNDEVRHLVNRPYPVVQSVPWLSDGVVAYADDESIYTNTASRGGDSGGVLINADMKAIGLVVLAAPRLKRGDDSNGSVGISTISAHFNVIREFLIEAGYLNE